MAGGVQRDRAEHALEEDVAFQRFRVFGPGRRLAYPRGRRPQTPLMSLTVPDSVIPVSSRSFSTRVDSWARDRVNCVRVRAKSRSRW